MRASLDRILGKPVVFPVEITLSSGDTYLLPHPDHAHMHPNTQDLIIYPDVGPFSLVVNPDQIVTIRAVRKASSGGCSMETRRPRRDSCVVPRRGRRGSS